MSNFRFLKNHAMKKFLTIVLLSTIFSLTGFSQKKPEPTEKEALLTVLAQNSDETVRAGEQIYFQGINSKKTYTGITGDSGTFYLLLPKGDSYNIRYKNFQDSVDYSMIEIPNEPGQIFFDFTLTVEPTKTYTLKDVHFDTGKATLRPESFTALNDLLEVMKMKKKMVIEIAGHTDDVGDDAANLALSQARAEAVRDYLVKKGIVPERITAKGYGETQPAATNQTEAGKQQNRRTEVRIIKE
jgi:outer membrane protein OmpA-like peptidoglycan-associated protein